MSLGLSWMMAKEDNGLPFIMHTGRDGAGFSSLCYLYPDHHAAIIKLINASNDKERVTDLKNELISNLIQGK